MPTEPHHTDLGAFGMKQGAWLAWRWGMPSGLGAREECVVSFSAHLREAFRALPFQVPGSRGGIARGPLLAEWCVANA